MNDTVKNTTIELSISSEYRRNVGLKEAFREFIQNALDAHDEGHTMTIERSKGAKKTITIRNEGVTLDRASLRLGHTTKGNGLSRGRHAEGYKIALMAIARLGSEEDNGVFVQIRTADEMWTASYGISATFGAEVLKVQIRQQPRYINAIEVQIHNVSDEEWEAIQKGFLGVPGIKDSEKGLQGAVKTTEGLLLTAPEQRGLLYYRGIFVTALPCSSSWNYGYDLFHVEMDIERKLADQHSLEQNIGHVLQSAFVQGFFTGKELLSAFLSGAKDMDALSSYLRYAGGEHHLVKAITKAFEEHTNTRYHVTSAAELAEASNLGIEAVMVPFALNAVLANSLPDWYVAKKQIKQSTRKSYNFEELTSEEQATLQGVLSTLEKVGYQYAPSIVDFADETLQGLANIETRVFSCARKCLNSYWTALGVCVHEVAHIEAQALDGTRSHTDKIEEIYLQILKENA